MTAANHLSLVRKVATSSTHHHVTGTDKIMHMTFSFVKTDPEEAERLRNKQPLESFVR
jgi:hypothetical protein